MIKNDQRYDESNINLVPMILVIEPNTINDKNMETIIRYSSAVLICYISIQKKNAMEQNNIWCKDIFPACIEFYNLHGNITSVLATAMICSKNNINVDKECIRSTTAVIQTFVSNIIIPRRFYKFLNNFFLG